MNPLALIGRYSLAFVEIVGRPSLFAGKSVAHCFLPPLYPCLILRPMFDWDQ